MLRLNKPVQKSVLRNLRDKTKLSSSENPGNQNNLKIQEFEIEKASFKTISNSAIFKVSSFAET